jgi:hypothetical protein
MSIKHNKYDLTGEFGIGWTGNTQQEFYFDLIDYDLIKDYHWIEIQKQNSTYKYLLAYNPKTQRSIRMHQLLAGYNIDHIDRNPFNNRRSNFRKASIAENNRNKNRQTNNSSGIIGVAWHKSKNKWHARIGINKKLKHIGYFENKKDAIKARLQAEKECFGEFAPQRHLFEQYGIT